jgi:radical SAM protein with 4Fe4S-binding SPASM domain
MKKNALLAVARLPGFLNHNTLQPKKVINRNRLMEDYRRGRIRLRGGPAVLQIEVTNRCTMRCPMCPHKHMTRPPVDMDVELFRKIIDENRDTAEIAILHLMGEPLLNASLPDMIRYCGEAGIHTVISSNASLLNEKRSEEIIDSGLDIIILSLDGFETETYEALRKGGRRDKILGQVNRFLEMKGPRRPKAIVQMIDMPETRDQSRAFARYWRQRPNVAVSLKPFTSWQGDLEEIRQKGWAVDLSRLEMSRCDRLYMWLTVFADGRVAVCCRDYDGTVKLDSIVDRDSREIWNGETLQAFRRSHRNGRSRTAVCRTCDYDPVIDRSFVARSASRVLDQYALYRMMSLTQREYA